MLYLKFVYDIGYWALNICVYSNEFINRALKLGSYPFECPQTQAQDKSKPVKEKC